MNKTMLALFFALLMATLCLSAAAEETITVDIGFLEPIEYAAPVEAHLTALFCGPTQGFYRHDDLCLDTGTPFTYFGQYDCWAMVGIGTGETLGAIGWVESAAIDAPMTPELSFDDAWLVMVEEDTFLTDAPLADEPPKLCTIPRGTYLTLLAQLDGWGYVQTDLGDTPIRAFLPLSSVF